MGLAWAVGPEFLDGEDATFLKTVHSEIRCVIDEHAYRSGIFVDEAEHPAPGTFLSLIFLRWPWLEKDQDSIVTDLGKYPQPADFEGLPYKACVSGTGQRKSWLYMIYWYRRAIELMTDFDSCWKMLDYANAQGGGYSPEDFITDTTPICRWPFSGFLNGAGELLAFEAALHIAVGRSTWETPTGFLPAYKMDTPPAQTEPSPEIYIDTPMQKHSPLDKELYREPMKLLDLLQEVYLHSSVGNAFYGRGVSCDGEGSDPAEDSLLVTDPDELEAAWNAAVADWDAGDLETAATTTHDQLPSAGELVGYGYDAPFIKVLRNRVYFSIVLDHLPVDVGLQFQADVAIRIIPIDMVIPDGQLDQWVNFPLTFTIASCTAAAFNSRGWSDTGTAVWSETINNEAEYDAFENGFKTIPGSALNPGGEAYFCVHCDTDQLVKQCAYYGALSVYISINGYTIKTSGIEWLQP